MQAGGQFTSGNLYMAPDYITAGHLLEHLSGIPLVGDAQKLPLALRPAGFYDAGDAQQRAALMLEAKHIDKLLIITPDMGYYRRMYELRDECFFVNLTLRLLEQGADVCLDTGMRKTRLLPKVKEWMETFRQYGIRLLFCKEEESREELIRELVTAKDVDRCFRQGKRELITGITAIVTPYALDEAKEKGVTICREL